MEAEIIKEDIEHCLIQWQSPKGFGQLMIKHTGNGHLTVDTECMSISHMIEVIKALDAKDYSR